MKNLILSGTLFFSVFMQADVTRFDIVRNQDQSKTILLIGDDDLPHPSEKSFDKEIIEDHVSHLMESGIPTTFFFEHVPASKQLGIPSFFEIQRGRATEIKPIEPATFKETIERSSSKLIILYSRRETMDTLGAEFEPTPESFPIHRRKELIEPHHELHDLLKFFASIEK